MSTEESSSKRPTETQFQQQTLQSWNPLILMRTVFPIFACVGTCFVLIGVLLLLLSMSVREIKLDYTNCKHFNGLNETNETCSALIDRNATSRFQTCTCVVNFQIPKCFNGQVYLYYSIQNLYQNHRRYVKSKDLSQLQGRDVFKVTSDCHPYDIVSNESSFFNYAPCGIIANSIFNDTFHLDYLNNGTVTIPVDMTSKGIAWKVDTDILYGQPQSWNNTLKPINWPKTALERNPNSYSGDEELLVWMRTSPLSTFKKLHRIIKHDQSPFMNGLPAGDYKFTINYAYPVTVFSGRKWVVLSTTSGMGGKNNNMAIIYMVVGVMQLLISMVFAIGTIFINDRQPNERQEIKLRMIKNPSDYMPINT